MNEAVYAFGHVSGHKLRGVKIVDLAGDSGIKIVVIKARERTGSGEALLICFPKCLRSHTVGGDNPQASDDDARPFHYLIC